MTGFVKVSLLVTGGLMLGLAAWGIATAIGLFRLRPWARISILVFSGLLAVYAGLTAVMVNVMPLPQTGNTASVNASIKSFVSIFYGVLALLGGGWLYFFNRAATKAQFTSSAGEQGRRPLSITIIAVYLLVSAVMLLVVASQPVPANLLGLLIGGLPGHLLYAAQGLVEIWLGIGLLRLKMLERKAAIWFCGFVALSSLLFVVLPGFTQRMSVSLALLPPNLMSQRSGDYARFMIGSLILGSLISLAPVWFLVSRKCAFGTGVNR